MFFLLGPESIRLYLTSGRMTRPGMRHRIFMLLCWMSSWKVWLEQRICAYSAFLFYHSELHNEQMARLKKRRLLLREVSNQASGGSDSKEVGTERKTLPSKAVETSQAEDLGISQEP
eukprot:s153_g16.t1